MVIERLPLASAEHGCWRRRRWFYGSWCRWLYCYWRRSRRNNIVVMWRLEVRKLWLIIEWRERISLRKLKQTSDVLS